MSAHLLPKLLKIGEYELDKALFIIKHEHQRKDSSGRKRRIEYSCDICSTIYETKLIVEQQKTYPFLCRSCRNKKEWKTEKYRNSHSVSEETKEIHRQNLSIRNKISWNDEIYRSNMISKLRARDPSWFSKAKKSMKTSVAVFHWKTNAQLICTGLYELSFVMWANRLFIDFDWQIPHKMPDGRTYIVDALIKSGEFSGQWIEIKGWMSPIGREKWEWFHSQYPETSQLWNQKHLISLGILDENCSKKKRWVTTSF